VRSRWGGGIHSVVPSGAFSGGPAAVGGEAVLGSAGQGFLVDVGLSAVGEVFGVVDLAPVGGDVAAGVGAAALEGMDVQVGYG
jgi:hypothetical protein